MTTDDKIALVIKKIESQRGRPILEGDELLEQENSHFYEILLVQFLKKYGSSSFSHVFLMSYIKFLRAFNLEHWERFIEAIADDPFALKSLLYFSYHYIKVDFFKTFPANKHLDNHFKTEYHSYAKLNPTVKRELEMGNFKPSDFEYIQEKLILQGAFRVSVEVAHVEIITDEYLDKLLKKDEGSI